MSIQTTKDQLMDAAKAEEAFNVLKGKCPHVCQMPMNKQTGKKKAFAFFTCVIAMLLEEAAWDCDEDTRRHARVAIGMRA